MFHQNPVCMTPAYNRLTLRTIYPSINLIDVLCYLKTETSSSILQHLLIDVKENLFELLTIYNSWKVREYGKPIRTESKGPRQG